MMYLIRMLTAAAVVLTLFVSSASAQAPKTKEAGKLHVAFKRRYADD